MRGTSVARGGWFGASHDTEEALADAGFVVAAINHPGDTFSDSSRRDTLSGISPRVQRGGGAVFSRAAR
jgi:predicted dienelactone hydrolase